MISSKGKFVYKLRNYNGGKILKNQILFNEKKMNIPAQNGQQSGHRVPQLNA